MQRVCVVLSLFGFLIVSCSTAFMTDPFGAPPKGATMNCGPEHRYKYQVRIRSKEEFIEFIDKHGSELKDQYGSSWVELDNFKEIKPGMSREEIAQAPVNWGTVSDAVTTERVGERTIYVLEFSPFGCMGRFTLKMTDDGHVSLYGCCGF